MTGSPDHSNFEEFFKKATGHKEPFDYQRRLAEEDPLPSLINIPTGAGKTAAVILAWLWRRRFHEREEIRQSTPRRLVYCLPMRVLVEQTRDNAILWLHRLELLGGSAKLEVENGKEKVKDYKPSWVEPEKIVVTVLMGGEDADEWDVYPERDAIIIGTQDMLLSRALNRGYAMSRAHWPMQFGLLHIGCLWVFDEIQLMGTGLATTAQLEAFRHLLGDKDGHGCQSLWMSATMQRDWLKTVDFKDRVDGLSSLKLNDDDYKNEEVRKRWRAKKPLESARSRIGDAAGIAKEIQEAHQPGARTIAVVNTVRRASELFEALSKPAASVSKSKGTRGKKAGGQDATSGAATTIPKPVLLHSRFRPGDRQKAMKAALADPPAEGTIIVSTQVIEAGVDVSATMLFTELAPWASLVQRFGRCNRRGTENDQARVFWIDLPSEKAADAAPPYELEQLTEGRRTLLEKCTNGVGPSDLPGVELPFWHAHVIRRKDLIDLFDTTPDLAGNDIDIDRFVREVEDSDVRVFWRDWQQPKRHEPPPEDNPFPRREELCPAPIGSKYNPGFRDFAKTHRGKGKAWRWSFLEKKWEEARPEKVAPGQVFLIHSDAGGYTPERGWDAESKARVEPVTVSNDKGAPSYLAVWQTIGEHADDTCRYIDAIVSALQLDGSEAGVIRESARWHDRGKAHEVFQNAVDDGQIVLRRGKTEERRQRPVDWRGSREVAKFPYPVRKNGKVVDHGWMKPYDWLPKEGRKHFRHELASALAVLDPRNGKIPAESRDLIAYLVATHHGKVRLSIRSWPEERWPEPRYDNQGENRRFARGVWDGDVLPATELGGGVMAPAVTLSLEPMELGLCEREPFKGQPSWAERMIRLRDTHGPFRLAYLEALLRAADGRASAAAVARAGLSSEEATYA